MREGSDEVVAAAAVVVAVVVVGVGVCAALCCPCKLPFGQHLMLKWIWLRDGSVNRVRGDREAKIRKFEP